MGGLVNDSLVYDPGNRIVEARQDPGGSNALMIETAYDGLGQTTELVSHVHAVDQIERYVLDGLGNIHLRWESPHHSDPDNNTGVDVYSYDPNGRLSYQAAEYPMDPQNRAGSYPRYRTQTYDANGDVKTVGGYSLLTDGASLLPPCELERSLHRRFG